MAGHGNHLECGDLIQPSNQLLEPIHLILQGDEHKRTGEDHPVLGLLDYGAKLNHLLLVPELGDLPLQHRQDRLQELQILSRQDPIGGVGTKPGGGRLPHIHHDTGPLLLVALLPFLASGEIGEPGQMPGLGAGWVRTPEDGGISEVAHIIQSATGNLPGEDPLHELPLAITGGIINERPDLRRQGEPHLLRLQGAVGPAVDHGRAGVP